jgi:hypothetical protein
MIRREKRKEMQLQFYKVMTIKIFLYELEAWVRRKKEENRIEAAKMDFLEQSRDVQREAEMY